MTLQEVPPTSGPSFDPSSSAIKSGSSTTIPEVQSQSLGAPAEIVANQFLGESPMIGTQVMPPISPPTTDATMPELSQMVPESNDDIMGSERQVGIFMDTLTVSDEVLPLELGCFSPNPRMEWGNSFSGKISFRAYLQLRSRWTRP